MASKVLSPTQLVRQHLSKGFPRNRQRVVVGTLYNEVSAANPDVFKSRTHFHKQILKQMRLRNELLYKVVEVPHRHTTRKQFTVTLKDTSKVRKYLAEIEEAAGGLDTDGMPRV